MHNNWQDNFLILVITSLSYNGNLLNFSALVKNRIRTEKQNHNRPDNNANIVY